LNSCSYLVNILGLHTKCLLNCPSEKKKKKKKKVHTKCSTICEANYNSTIMPQKRGKGKASSSGSSSLRLVDKKFVNEAAKAKFGKFMEKNKSIIVERGLRPPEFDIEGDIANNIVQRQWHNLTDIQNSAVTTVVREFYANGYYQRDNDEVCVRGTMVSFAPEVINRYFDIGTVEDDEYAAFLEEGGDYDPIVREMCIPGTEWTSRENDSDVAHYFPENCLNIYAKAWNKFICASIMPTKHEHHVYTNRAALLYAICKGWSIDIGVVIGDDLVKSLEAKTTGAHTHPCLITGLCQNAGVTIEPTEPLRPCGMLIDKSSMDKYVKWPGGRHIESGLGFELYDNHDAPRPPNLLPRLRILGGRNQIRGVSAQQTRAIQERERIIEENRHRQPSRPRTHREEAGPSSAPDMTHVVPPIEDVYRMAVQQGQNLTELQGRLNQQDRVLHEVLDRVKDMQQRDIMRSRYELQFHQYLASQGLPNSSTAMPPAYPDYLLRPYHPPPPPPETQEGSDDDEGM
jgi:hypothetical protein